MLIGRTAPSASGPPHLGTLFSALLALWQAQRHGARALARIEDLDRGRVRTEYVASLVTALQAVGYRAEDITLQHVRGAQHAQALDALAARGLLYACTCTRARLRRDGPPLAGGGVGYDNACRARGPISPDAWRTCRAALRLALPAGPLPAALVDGAYQIFSPAQREGDPIVRRKDGTIAYVFASVVDDVAAGVTQIVRGRDLAPLTPQQVAIAYLLGAAAPSYRHHVLLLSGDGKKLSKSRGDGRPWSAAQAAALCAQLQARLAAWGIGPDAMAWHRLPQADLVWPHDLLPGALASA